MANLDEKRIEILNMIQQYNASCDLLGGKKIVLSSDASVIHTEFPEERSYPNAVKSRILGLSKEVGEIYKTFSAFTSSYLKYYTYENWIRTQGFHKVYGCEYEYVFTDPYGIYARFNDGTIEFYESLEDFKKAN